jgi:hypothetical protein
MRGRLVSVTQLWGHRRTHSWCVTYNGRRLHVNATYRVEEGLNPVQRLESVDLGGCGCGPLKELPPEVMLQAENLWPKG